ncbi:CpsB/CapC family capsule biosynthesis tyrosine phosphatase, partial [Exiguobacterium sp.]
MVDIHCHILPLVDDGPASVEHALQLAEQAVAEG